MARIKEKERRRYWLYLRVLFLLLFFCLFVRAVWQVYGKDRLAEANLSAAKTRLAKLEGRQDELKEKMAQLDTLRGIEGQIRQNFNVIKSGEKVISIIDKNKEATATDNNIKVWWRFW